MDQYSKKQAWIRQRCAEVSSRYPELWSNIIAEWNSPGDDRVWLTYSANYLFRTENIRWAIDPLTLSGRRKDAPTVNVTQDLNNLSFALLTHRHEDHLALDLISALRDLPIKWVVPDFMLRLVIKGAGLPHENIIVPSHLKPIELNGIRILPFSGLHWETTPCEIRRGVPAVGYLIELNGKRWLFPGDTRTYEACRFPDFGPVDHLFAHLWLGQGCALMEEPPLTEAFCKFCLDFKPRKITLTHLNEFGRDANDYWDDVHVQLVCSKFREMSANLQVAHLIMGTSVLL